MAALIVTYGSGAKGKITGVGTLNVEGFPKLRNMSFVDGLVANLVSISQLCDDNLLVKFNKDACEVYTQDGALVMSGKRSQNNCYLIKGKICFSAMTNESILWHPMMGHTNVQNMMKLQRFASVCQKGKQVRSSHPVVTSTEQPFTTHASLELLHMDLMGPVEVESLGGKRYSFVIVDDFTRYT